MKAWSEHFDLKHKFQTLVQEKIAKHNLRLTASLREEGKAASQMFWLYVQSLDWEDKCSVKLRNAATGEPVMELKEHLTAHLLCFYGLTERSEDEAQVEETRAHVPRLLQRSSQLKGRLYSGGSARVELTVH